MKHFLDVYKQNLKAAIKILLVGICTLLCSVLLPNIQTWSQTSVSSLSKHFENSCFSIDYPDTWEIVNEEYQLTSQTKISVQIMEKQKNDYDFLPNINIIVSNKKLQEPASTLAKISVAQLKGYRGFRFIRQTDNITLSKTKGSMIDFELTFMGYSLYEQQYIVKKADNTTFTITIAWDKNHSTQNKVLIDILNTLIIK